MADQILAFRVSITEPEYLKNLNNYLTATGAVGTRAGNQAQVQRYGDVMEAQLARFYEMKSGGAEARAIPDLLEPSARMARAMGLITEEEFTASEVKAKQRLGESSTATKIGQVAPFGTKNPVAAPLIEAIKGQAGVTRDPSGQERVPESLDINDPTAVLKAAREKFGKTGGRGFFNLIRDNDPALHMEFYLKTRNLTITKGITDKKGRIVSADVFQIHFPFGKFTAPPFSTELRTADASISYLLSTAFEKDLIKNLQSSAPAILAKNVEEFQKGLTKLPGRRKTTKEKTMQGVAVGYGMILGVPGGGSIRRLNVKLRRSGSRRKGPAPKRGRFVSNVQLSAILQQRLSQRMPRYPEPQRPTPRYITGKLANSFQLMANYRTGVMGYFNTPPASGYVDELNTNGWLLDETLVEPTIRQITQQLFGRQFRVLRTQ